MGYFPGTQPGGGEGFEVIWSTLGYVYDSFNGNVISVTLNALTNYVHFRVISTIGGGYAARNKVGTAIGEALIDCSDHSFKVITGGARQGISSPLEHIGSESKTLLGDLPGVLYNSTEHIARISAYTGAGNNITVYAYAVHEDTINATSGKLDMIVQMTQFRRS